MTILTESPIEAEFLSALRSVHPSVVVVGSSSLEEMRRLAMGSNDGVFVAPQMPLGRYRLDFLLAAHGTPMMPNFVCVECDGRAFHRATVVQRDRDSERDRAVEAKLITVLRFSGARLRRDPYRCARVALDKVTGGRLGAGTSFETVAASLARGFWAEAAR